MRFFKLIIAIFICSIFLNSCATVFHGPKQTISVNSTPSGASIYVNGNNTGKTTPADIKVTRRVKTTSTSTKQKQTYTLKKEGYQDKTHVDGSTFNVPTFIASTFLGFIVSLSTDAISGSNRSYPKRVNLTLNKGSSSSNNGLLIDRNSDDSTPLNNGLNTISNSEKIVGKENITASNSEKINKKSVNEILEEFNTSLKIAVSEENYEKAEEIKNKIAKLNANKPKIEALEKEKENAILIEDYDKAQVLEKQISALKN